MLTASLGASFTSSVQPLENGFHLHPEWGLFATEHYDTSREQGWLWHEALGWVWLDGGDAENLVWWSVNQGWLGAATAQAPHIYSHEEEAWYFLTTSGESFHRNIGWSYNHATERWVHRDAPLAVDGLRSRTDEFFSGEFMGTSIGPWDASDVEFRLHAGEGFRIEGENLLVLSADEPGDYRATVRLVDQESGRSALVDRTFRIFEETLLIEGTVGPEGGILTDAWQEIVLNVPPGAVDTPANFRVLQGVRSSGYPSYRVETEGDVELEILPSLAVPLTTAGPAAGEARGGAGGLQPTGAMMTLPRVRMHTPGHFLRISNYSYIELESRWNFSLSTNRLPLRDPQLTYTDSWWSPWMSGSLSTLPAAASRLVFKGPPALDPAGRTPVLLIHGFSPDMEVDWDGDWDMVDRYWHDLPSILSARIDSESNPRFAVYEFQWRTNSRFNDAAADLGQAIAFVARETGNRVHLVAHSFGGLLARTYLQDFATGMPYQNNVASLVTIGTPHGGIFGSAGERHGVWLPDGRQGLVGRTIPLNQSSSGYQAGSGHAGLYTYTNWLGNYDMRDELGLSTEGRGEIPAALADLSTLPDVPTNVLIGLYYSSELVRNDWITGSAGGRTFQYRAKEGDGLISFDSQRFHPQWVGGGFVWPSSEADVREQLIQNPPLMPGEATTEDVRTHPYRGGYAHSTKNLLNNGLVQTRITWDNHSDHRVYRLLDQWLSEFEDAPFDPSVIEMRARVVDGETGQPLPEAFVRVIRANASLAGAETDLNGDITIPEVPFLPFSTYTLVVEAPGYRTREFDRDVRTGAVLEQGSYNFGRLDLVPDATEPSLGDVALTVVNASTGARLADAEVTLLNTFGFPLRKGTTDGNGNLSWTGLAPGNYRAVAARDGFRDSVQSFFVTGNASNSATIALNAILPQGQARIVLTWGANPRDLDSHLLRYSADGGRDYHIYFANRTGRDGDFLDTDNTSGFGPETITIQDLDPSKTYVYVVHRFAGSGSLAGSNASVEVTFGEGEPRRFIVPTHGSGDYWRVFTIRDGVLRPCEGGCMFESRAAALSLDPVGGMSDVEPFADLPKKSSVAN